MDSTCEGCRMMAGDAKCKIRGAPAWRVRDPPPVSTSVSMRPVPSIRLIAIDIDGPLLDRAGNIPDENRQAIAAALDRGIEVALVTGRGFTFAHPVAEALALPGVLG